ncbi:hypothetical protein FQR65_LT05824 [Abscondita terminalis]|nr:hypothetical protein FQR65_LT05824 [Abscondita terminalis]
MAPMKLYKIDASPGVRAVHATAISLGVEFEEIIVDLLKGEQFNEDYLKINPLHLVPTLDDNGLIICDSHVINAYLVQKYGKDDALYPKDLNKRVLVDQKLAFDLGTLFPTLRKIDDAYEAKEITSVTPELKQKVDTVYKYLEKMLEGKQWVSLDHVTIADFSCYATATSLNYHVPCTYPNIINWINRCKKLPCFADDPRKIEEFKNFIETVKQ